MPIRETGRQIGRSEGNARYVADQWLWCLSRDTCAETIAEVGETRYGTNREAEFERELELFLAGAARGRKATRWQQARLAAVQALSRLTDPAVAAKGLTAALFDPTELIRDEAFALLAALGEAAEPALVEAARSPRRWTLPGMLLVVRALAPLPGHDSRHALAELTLGLWPIVPSVEETRWVSGTYKSVMGIGALCWLVGIIAAAVAASESTDPFSEALTGLIPFAIGFPIFMHILMLPIFAVVSPFAASLRADRRRIMSLTAGASIGGPNAFSVLPRLLSGMSGGGRPAGLEPTVRRLLFGVGPDSGITLSHEQRMRLRDLLRTRSDGLVLAALRGVEHLGGSESIRHVARLAKREADPAIRAESARILPILESRREAELQPGVLLRASEAPKAAPTELLRTVAETPETQPEQLLRPR